MGIWLDDTATNVNKEGASKEHETDMPSADMDPVPKAADADAFEARTGAYSASRQVISLLATAGKREKDVVVVVDADPFTPPVKMEAFEETSSDATKVTGKPARSSAIAGGNDDASPP